MKPFILGSLTLFLWAYGLGMMLALWTDHPLVGFAERTFPAFVVLILVAFFAYIVDALRNPRVPDQKRKLWAVVLVLAHVYAQPFYWWWYVRPLGSDRA